MKILYNKKALVTGAASGIGRAIGLELGRQGVNLFLVDKDPEKLQAVFQECQNLCILAQTMLCDISQREEVEVCVQRVHEVWGELDILVNSAGVLYYGSTKGMSLQQWDEVLATNLHAPIQFIVGLLPLLQKKEEAHILNVCSVMGLVPKRKMAAYQTTKYGLVGLSASLRAELSPSGLGVTIFCPGLVRTNLLKQAKNREWMTSRLDPPNFMYSSPEAVAVRAVKAIRNNHGVVVTTAYARFLWFLQRLSPRIFDYWQHWKDRTRSKLKASS